MSYPYIKELPEDVCKYIICPLVGHYYTEKRAKELEEILLKRFRKKYLFVQLISHKMTNDNILLVLFRIRNKYIFVPFGIKDITITETENWIGEKSNTKDIICKTEDILINMPKKLGKIAIWGSLVGVEYLTILGTLKIAESMGFEYHTATYISMGMFVSLIGLFCGSEYGNTFCIWVGSIFEKIDIKHKTS
jgi:hypothetical protein